LSGIRNFRRITSALRFRLTVGYALFICVMLIGVGAIYRQKLATILDNQVRDGLEQEWAAAKGYLRIEKGSPHWYFDHFDPDESFMVERIRRVYMLADAQYNIMEISETYKSIVPIRPPILQPRCGRAARLESTQERQRHSVFDPCRRCLR